MAIRCFLTLFFLVGSFCPFSWAQDEPTDFYQSIELPAKTPIFRDGTTYRLDETTSLRVTGHGFTATGRLYYQLEPGGYSIYATHLEASLPGCNVGDTNRNRNDLGQMVLTVSTKDAPFQPLTSNKRYTPHRDGWARGCYQFIRSDGSIGPYGQKTLDAIAATGSECIYDPFLWQHLCPKFGEFTQERKEHFIAYFYATKAMAEASCNNRSTNGNATNGMAVGLFQLEQSSRLRAGRGRFCAGSSANVSNLTFQFQCATSQIRDIHCADRRPFGVRGGYWAGANSLNGVISRPIIGGYEACSN